MEPYLIVFPTTASLVIITIMTTQQIYDLTEASQAKLVGGKALALNEMACKGFNVPKGFVISANSFMRMTPFLHNKILASFDKLQTQYVAVRSSAINEDGKNDTWAGQLETYLNCTKGNLLANIQKCWDSANSSRAQSYAAQKGSLGTKVAVIVQEMIQGEVSGVAFSAHPVTNNKKQIVIEAGLGLGEAVVSGKITPDNYVIDKETGQIAETHISHQTIKLTRGNKGDMKWEEVNSSKQKLTNEQLMELCSLTAKLEAFFDLPVDIEWTIYKGEVYILQSRPITTLEQK